MASDLTSFQLGVVFGISITLATLIAAGLLVFACRWICNKLREPDEPPF